MKVCGISFLIDISPSLHFGRLGFPCDVFGDKGSPPGAGTQLFDPRMSVKGPPPGRRRHDPQMASGGRDTTRRWSPRGGEDGEGRHDPRMGGHFPHQVLLPQEGGWI